MKILFVSTSTTVGGAEKTLYTLASRLDPKEFTVAGVVSLKPTGHYGQRLAELGVKTWSLGIQKWPLLSDATALAGIIQEARPDLVHALMYQAIELCRFVKRRADPPFRLISSPRVNYRTRSCWTLLIDRMLRRADDLLIAESDASRGFLVDRLGYDASRVKTIHNGVDAPSSSLSQSDRQNQRQKLGIGDDEFLIGAAGRLDEQKGHCVLIDAVALLKNSRKIRCIILGEGPRRDALEAQCRRLNLEDAVRILGERQDALSCLGACDAFVLPSLWEGLPNALLEAMSLGLPVVASKVDGVPEAVASSQDGLLVQPQDPEALARAVASLISDPQLRGSLGAAARERVAAHFSLHGMLASYQAAYREVLSRPTA